MVKDHFSLNGRDPGAGPRLGLKGATLIPKTKSEDAKIDFR